MHGKVALHQQTDQTNHRASRQGPAHMFLLFPPRGFLRLDFTMSSRRDIPPGHFGNICDYLSVDIVNTFRIPSCIFTSLLMQMTVTLKIYRRVVYSDYSWLRTLWLASHFHDIQFWEEHLFSREQKLPNCCLGCCGETGKFGNNTRRVRLKWKGPLPNWTWFQR